MKHVIVLLFVAIFAFSNSFGQDKFSSGDTLTLLIKNSKQANKKLFMVFGWQGCSWCRVFDKYHSDSLVSSILSKYFIISKVDMVRSVAGAELFKTYGKGGTPSWIVFNTDGKVLIDSDNGKGNVGYPAEISEIEHYVKALKQTATGIIQAECDTLVYKLRDYRNKKKQNII